MLRRLGLEKCLNKAATFFLLANKTILRHFLWLLKGGRTRGVPSPLQQLLLSTTRNCRREKVRSTVTRNMVKTCTGITGTTGTHIALVIPPWSGVLYSHVRPLPCHAVLITKPQETEKRIENS